MTRARDYGRQNSEQTMTSALRSQKGSFPRDSQGRATYMLVLNSSLELISFSGSLILYEPSNIP